MRILIVLQHYHTPDCATAARPYALVHRLAEDHALTIITSDAWRAKRQTYRFDWIPDGAHHIELSVPYGNAMGVVDRLRSYFSFAARAVAVGMTATRPDLVFGSSTPLTAALAADLIAARWGVPWIFEVRDLWPAFPIQMGAVPPVLADALQGLERYLYRRASHVVTASPDMAQHVRHGAPDTPVSTVAYGSDFERLDRTGLPGREAVEADLGLAPGERIALYAGSFGRANAIPSLIDAASMLRDRSELVFVFVGDGYYRPALERARHRLPNLRLVAPQPYWRTLSLFQAAQLSLVPFVDRPVLRANAPSKLFDSLAAGTPAIVTTPGWTKSLVESQGCGWYVPPSSPHRLAHRIQTLIDSPSSLEKAGIRASQFAAKHLRRSHHMERMASVVRDVTDAGKWTAEEDLR
jgi:glycosyltransferase involved in cell wall biosynthesis